MTTGSTIASETWELRERVATLEATLESLQGSRPPRTKPPEEPGTGTDEAGVSRRMLLRSLAGVGTGAALGTAAAALLATPAAALAGEWQIYTPSLTAATTNPNLGGGSANGHYLWDGRLVVVKANITFGNTETAGAGLGQYRVSLPVTPKLGSDAWLGPTGMAILNKKYSGLLRHASVILTDDSPQIVSFKLDNDTGPVDNDTPWVWANVPNPSTQSKADSISMFMIYEASADPS